MRIAVFADSGPSIGLGHCARSVALAKAVQKNAKKSVQFFTPDAKARRWVRRQGLTIGKDLNQPWDLLVLDSYRTKKQLSRSIIEGSKKIVLLHDGGPVPVKADVIINTAVSVKKSQYTAVKSGFRLLGPTYHPLRPEFLSKPGPHVFRRQVKSIFLSLGGGSHEKFLRMLCALIKKNFPDREVQLVLGPYKSQAKRPRSGGHVFRHVNPKRLWDVMRKCDVAVCAGGQTLYELAYFGIPALVFPLAENQRPHMEGFRKGGYAQVCSMGKNWQHRFVGKLQRLLFDQDLRKKMSVAGKRMVDGRGAERVARILLRGKR